MRKRILSLILCLSMLVGLLPSGALAADPDLSITTVTMVTYDANNAIIGEYSVPMNSRITTANGSTPERPASFTLEVDGLAFEKSSAVWMQSGSSSSYLATDGALTQFPVAADDNSLNRYSLSLAEYGDQAIGYVDVQWDQGLASYELNNQEYTSNSQPVIYAGYEYVVEVEYADGINADASSVYFGGTKATQTVISDTQHRYTFTPDEEMVGSSWYISICAADGVTAVITDELQVEAAAATVSFEIVDSSRPVGDATTVVEDPDEYLAGGEIYLSDARLNLTAGTKVDFWLHENTGEVFANNTVAPLSHGENKFYVYLHTAENISLNFALQDDFLALDGVDSSSISFTSGGNYELTNSGNVYTLSNYSFDDIGPLTMPSVSSQYTVGVVPYTFKGWTTTPNMKDMAEANLLSVNGSSAYTYSALADNGITDGATLYAYYEPASVTVVYQYDETFAADLKISTEITRETKTTEKVILSTPSATFEGSYTFLYWKLGDTAYWAGKEYHVSEFVSSLDNTTGEVVFVAEYAANGTTYAYKYDLETKTEEKYSGVTFNWTTLSGFNDGTAPTVELLRNLTITDSGSNVYGIESWTIVYDNGLVDTVSCTDSNESATVTLQGDCTLCPTFTRMVDITIVIPGEYLYDTTSTPGYDSDTNSVRASYSVYEGVNIENTFASINNVLYGFYDENTSYTNYIDIDSTYPYMYVDANGKVLFHYDKSTVYFPKAGDVIHLALDAPLYPNVESMMVVDGSNWIYSLVEGLTRDIKKDQTVPVSYEDEDGDITSAKLKVENLTAKTTQTIFFPSGGTQVEFDVKATDEYKVFLEFNDGELIHEYHLLGVDNGFYIDFAPAGSVNFDTYFSYHDGAEIPLENGTSLWKPTGLWANNAGAEYTAELYYRTGANKAYQLIDTLTSLAQDAATNGYFTMHDMGEPGQKLLVIKHNDSKVASYTFNLSNTSYYIYTATEQNGTYTMAASSDGIYTANVTYGTTMYLSCIAESKGAGSHYGFTPVGSTTLMSDISFTPTEEQIDDTVDYSLWFKPIAFDTNTTVDAFDYATIRFNVVAPEAQLLVSTNGGSSYTPSNRGGFSLEPGESIMVTAENVQEGDRIVVRHTWNNVSNTAYIFSASDLSTTPATITNDNEFGTVEIELMGNRVDESGTEQETTIDYVHAEMVNESFDITLDGTSILNGLTLEYGIYYNYDQEPPETATNYALAFAGLGAGHELYDDNVYDSSVNLGHSTSFTYDPESATQSVYRLMSKMSDFAGYAPLDSENYPVPAVNILAICFNFGQNVQYEFKDHNCYTGDLTGTTRVQVWLSGSNDEPFGGWGQSGSGLRVYLPYIGSDYYATLDGVKLDFAYWKIEYADEPSLNTTYSGGGWFVLPTPQDANTKATISTWWGEGVTLTFKPGDGAEGNSIEYPAVQGADFSMTYPKWTWTLTDEKNQFAGWKNDATGDVFMPDAPITGFTAEASTFTAQYTQPVEYNFYNFEWDTYTAASVTVYPGVVTDGYIAPAASEYNGRTLKGWKSPEYAAAMDLSEDTILAPGGTFSIPSGETAYNFYAVWEWKIGTIDFSIGDVLIPRDTTELDVYLYGTGEDADISLRDSYSYATEGLVAGWTIDGVDSGNVNLSSAYSSYMSTGETATWTFTIYEATYNAEDGTMGRGAVLTSRTLKINALEEVYSTDETTGSIMYQSEVEGEKKDITQTSTYDADGIFYLTYEPAEGSTVTAGEWYVECSSQTRLKAESAWLTNDPLVLHPTIPENGAYTFYFCAEDSTDPLCYAEVRQGVPPMVFTITGLDTDGESCNEESKTYQSYATAVVETTDGFTLKFSTEASGTISKSINSEEPTNTTFDTCSSLEFDDTGAYYDIIIPPVEEREESRLYLYVNMNPSVESATITMERSDNIELQLSGDGNYWYETTPLADGKVTLGYTDLMPEGSAFDDDPTWVVKWTPEGSEEKQDLGNTTTLDISKVGRYDIDLCAPNGESTVASAVLVVADTNAYNATLYLNDVESSETTTYGLSAANVTLKYTSEANQDESLLENAVWNIYTEDGETRTLVETIEAANGVEVTATKLEDDVSYIAVLNTAAGSYVSELSFVTGEPKYVYFKIGGSETIYNSGETVEVDFTDSFTVTAYNTAGMTASFTCDSLVPNEAKVVQKEDGTATFSDLFWPGSYEFSIKQTDADTGAELANYTFYVDVADPSYTLKANDTTFENESGQIYVSSGTNVTLTGAVEGPVPASIQWRVAVNGEIVKTVSNGGTYTTTDDTAVAWLDVTYGEGKTATGEAMQYTLGSITIYNQPDVSPVVTNTITNTPVNVTWGDEVVLNAANGDYTIGLDGDTTNYSWKYTPTAYGNLDYEEEWTAADIPATIDENGSDENAYTYMLYDNVKSQYVDGASVVVYLIDPTGLALRVNGKDPVDNVELTAEDMPLTISFAAADEDENVANGDKIVLDVYVDGIKQDAINGIDGELKVNLGSGAHIVELVDPENVDNPIDTWAAKVTIDLSSVNVSFTYNNGISGKKTYDLELGKAVYLVTDTSQEGTASGIMTLTNSNADSTVVLLNNEGTSMLDEDGTAEVSFTFGENGTAVRTLYVASEVPPEGDTSFMNDPKNSITILLADISNVKLLVNEEDVETVRLAPTEAEKVPVSFYGLSPMFPVALYEGDEILHQFTGSEFGKTTLNLAEGVHTIDLVNTTDNVLLDSVTITVKDPYNVSVTINGNEYAKDEVCYLGTVTEATLEVTDNGNAEEGDKLLGDFVWRVRKDGLAAADYTSTAKENPFTVTDLEEETTYKVELMNGDDLVCVRTIQTSVSDVYFQVKFGTSGETKNVSLGDTITAALGETITVTPVYGAGNTAPAAYSWGTYYVENGQTTTSGTDVNTATFTQPLEAVGKFGYVLNDETVFYVDVQCPEFEVQYTYNEATKTVQIVNGVGKISDVPYMSTIKLNTIIDSTVNAATKWIDETGTKYTSADSISVYGQDVELVFEFNAGGQLIEVAMPVTISLVPNDYQFNIELGNSLDETKVYASNLADGDKVTLYRLVNGSYQLRADVANDDTTANAATLAWYNSDGNRVSTGAEVDIPSNSAGTHTYYLYVGGVPQMENGVTVKIVNTAQLFVKVGDEVKSESSIELTSDDVAKGVTISYTGADDGTLEAFLYEAGDPIFEWTPTPEKTSVDVTERLTAGFHTYELWAYDTTNGDFITLDSVDINVTADGDIHVVLVDAEGAETPVINGELKSMTDPSLRSPAKVMKLVYTGSSAAELDMANAQWTVQPLMSDRARPMTDPTTATGESIQFGMEAPGYYKVNVSVKDAENKLYPFECMIEVATDVIIELAEIVPDGDTSNVVNPKLNTSATVTVGKTYSLNARVLMDPYAEHDAFIWQYEGPGYYAADETVITDTQNIEVPSADFTARYVMVHEATGLPYAYIQLVADEETQENEELDTDTQDPATGGTTTDPYAPDPEPVIGDDPMKSNWFNEFLSNLTESTVYEDGRVVGIDETTTASNGNNVTLVVEDRDYSIEPPIYKVELNWGDMAFKLTRTESVTTVWNPNNHSRTTTARTTNSGDWHLVTDTELKLSDKVIGAYGQDSIIIFNHSNMPVNATIGIEDVNADDNVGLMLTRQEGAPSTTAASTGYTATLVRGDEDAVYTTVDAFTVGKVTVQGAPSKDVIAPSKSETHIANVTITLVAAE